MDIFVLLFIINEYLNASNEQYIINFDTFYNNSINDDNSLQLLLIIEYFLNSYGEFIRYEQ